MPVLIFQTTTLTSSTRKLEPERDIFISPFWFKPVHSELYAGISKENWPSYATWVLTKIVEPSNIGLACFHQFQNCKHEFFKKNLQSLLIHGKPSFAHAVLQSSLLKVENFFFKEKKNTLAQIGLNSVSSCFDLQKCICRSILLFNAWLKWRQFSFRIMLFDMAKQTNLSQKVQFLWKDFFWS